MDGWMDLTMQTKTNSNPTLLDMSYFLFLIWLIKREHLYFSVDKLLLVACNQSDGVVVST